MRHLALLTVLLAATTVRAETPPAAGPKPPPDFPALLARYADSTYPQLLDSLPTREPLEKLSFQPADAKYYDLVAGKLGLQAAERKLLEQNGFVIIHRGPTNSFTSTYLQFYRDDLPLLVTTDSVLHAMHRAYDDILQDMEETYLHAALRSILTRCQQELAARGQAGYPAALGDNYRDADLYLTMALTLLEGQAEPSTFGQDRRVSQLLGFLDSLEMQLPPAGTDLYGGRRAIDASQFKPRGHYTKSERLKSYFRAMMWLSRADTGFILLPPDPRSKIVADSPRELRDAALLAQLLVSSGAIAQLDQMNRLIEFMAGKSDSLTVFAFAKLLEKEGLRTDADLADRAKIDRIQKAVRAGRLGEQQINSQIVASHPLEPDQVPPPCLFQVFGQRYAVDSFVLSQVVYDSVLFHGNKMPRAMPSGLDVAFTLGSGEAAKLLAPDLERYNYSGNLRACANFVSGQPEAFWQASLYNIWLDGLRGLDEPPGEKHFPQAMRTRAWRHKQLQTQLASWAELRHDNILYVKQSYSKHSECEYPSVFVEPYPKVYARLKFFCEEAARHIAAANFPYSDARGHDVAVRQAVFLRSMAQTFGRLETLARKELAAEPFDAADRAWLKHTVSYHRCDSGDDVYDGWYFKLFYRSRPAEVLAWAPVVADVHTAPPVLGGSDESCVLEVGTGGVDYVVAVVDNQSDRAVYVGPAYSYYEFTWPVQNRLTDEQWRAMLTGGGAPPRPPWTDVFRAGR